MAVVVVGLREVQHEFYRVAPEESVAYAWLVEKGARVGKEGKDRHIVSVSLEGKSVSDSEIKRLLDLTRLRKLELAGTAITDAGLHALLPLKELEYVDVSNTRVTADGYMAFLEKQRSVRRHGRMEGENGDRSDIGKVGG